MIHQSKNFLKSEFFDIEKVYSLLRANSTKIDREKCELILSRALQIHLKGSMNIDLSLSQCQNKLNTTKKVLITPYAYNLSISEYFAGSGA